MWVFRERRDREKMKSSVGCVHQKGLEVSKPRPLAVQGRTERASEYDVKQDSLQIN